MSQKPKVRYFLFDITKEIQKKGSGRTAGSPEGIVTISIGAENLILIGNYAPVILMPPTAMAQQFAKGFLSALGRGVIIEHPLLNCDSRTAERLLERIWSSLEKKITDNYRVAILVLES